MATFDKKAYAEQIANLNIEEVQDRIVDIDERTYDDLKKREVLVERRKVLFQDQSPDGLSIKLKRWAFGYKQMKKPHFPEILKKNKGVGSHIIKKHPEMLTISRDNLETVLTELGYNKDQIEEFVGSVSMNTAPTVTAKKLL